MNLIEYLDLFAGALINEMFCVIIIKKVFKLNVVKNKLLVISLMLFVSIISCILNIYNKDIFKVLFIIPFITISIKYIFNTETIISFMYAVIAIIYMFLGEILVTIVFSIIPTSYIYGFSNIMGKSIGTMLVSILTIPFLNINVLKITFKKAIEKVNYKKSIFWCVFLIAVIGALAYKNTRSIESIMSILVNLIIYAFLGFMILLVYKESKKSEQLSNEYNVLLKYLDKYEIELDEKRKIVHDFKNQLIVINGYADESNKKLKEYISEIIKDQKQLSFSSSLIKGVEKLPKGIKGLVYYKLSQLDKSYITEINVSNNLNKFNDINLKIGKDILKIIGILIDNAIEAVNNLEKKYINLKFLCKNGEIIIEVINAYYEKIDQEKLMTSGYSTKGENRGYGLTIVNDIVKNNKKIYFKIENINYLFKAILKIKVK